MLPGGLLLLAFKILKNALISAYVSSVVTLFVVVVAAIVLGNGGKFPNGSRFMPCW